MTAAKNPDILNRIKLAIYELIKDGYTYTSCQDIADRLKTSHNTVRKVIAADSELQKWQLVKAPKIKISKAEIKEVTKKESRIKHLELQNRQLKRKLEAVNEERRRMEDLLECKEATAWINPISLGCHKTKGFRSQATAIIGCTDWHCEGQVDPDIVADHNRFDLDIAAQRIKRTWEKAIYMLEFARGISNIMEVVLWFGGDLINGIIHEELEEKNFLGPTEAMLFAQDHMSGGIEYLKQHAGVERIVVVTNHGNHGRTTPKVRVSTAYRHSWEWLAYNQLARLYNNDPMVEFRIAKGYHNCQTIQGWRVRFHHGDRIRYAGGIGGIAIPVRKRIDRWNRVWRADLDVFGHFHQFMHHWDFVSSGCLIGYDGYAMANAFEPQPPTQLFMVIDQEYGNVITAPIFCEKDHHVRN